MDYVIDIETKPNEELIYIYDQKMKIPKNYKTDEAIEKYIEKQKKERYKKMSVDTDYCKIVCIWMYTKEELKIFQNVEEFFDWVRPCLNDRIITFNGKNFDLPILLKQAAKEWIKISEFWKEAKKRYSKNHIDLMEELWEYGKYKSLDEYLQIYLWIEKTPIEFEKASQKEIEEHCWEDLENTWKLFNLFSFIIK